jgi:hypothetical protein
MVLLHHLLMSPPHILTVLTDSSTGKCGRCLQVPKIIVNNLTIHVPTNKHTVYKVLFRKIPSLSFPPSPEAESLKKVWKGTFSGPKSRLSASILFIRNSAPGYQSQEPYTGVSLFCLGKTYKVYIQRMAAFLIPHERCALHTVQKPERGNLIWACLICTRHILKLYLE